MTLKIELAVAGTTLFVLGAFVAMQGADAIESVAVEPVDVFTPHDFAAFDREFEWHGETCVVGLERHGLCLGQSPLESQLKRGEILPDYVPALSAEFRVIVETDLKNASYQTVRFGRTLLLIDPETRVVHDILHLDAPDYETAQQDNFTPA